MRARLFLALVALVSLVAAAPLLWSDESEVLSWLPPLVSKRFQITTEAAMSVLMAAGFSAGLLTQKLREWRRWKLLSERLGPVATALVAGAYVEHMPHSARAAACDRLVWGL